MIALMPDPAVPTTDAPALAILRSLRRILRRVELSSSELEQAHAITQPQLVCLRAITASGRCTQSDLSREVHLSASTLVGVIDRLEAKGLVTRTRDQDDRRRIFLAPTAAGLRKAEVAPEPLHQRVSQALGELPLAEQRRIERALSRLVTLLEAENEEDQPMLASGPIPKPQDLEGQGR